MNYQPNSLSLKNRWGDNMNITIVEDEELAAGYLEKILKKQQVIKISTINILSTVKEAISYLSTNTPDLIFFDVHLADGSSMEVLEAVEIKAPIIFTTAYDKYAIEAFKHFTIDYLLKPYEADSLIEALNKLKTMKESFTQDKGALVRHLKGGGSSFQERFLIQHAHQLKSIEAEEIAYFYASGKHLFIYTFSRQSYLYNSTVRDIISQLDPNRFFKINRNYVVNIKAVNNVVKASYAKLSVDLYPPPPDENKVILSKTEISNFKKWLNK
ncbi:LytTR family DNA-binding domain-containing protein [Fulvivirga maritima]|uniref:LytR/AlgR family response regulator transcription factor n=1 Tax=Fulvivirga maritima TaxID=2904247 RepID=UPI001F1856B2|nr:LytTR family DNA-binding domain-containing protein [Fulvivirga maritima]UII28196.1 LytTR family DNA-binding domain-containing protein [Fulvivirga maritima]